MNKVYGVDMTAASAEYQRIHVAAWAEYQFHDASRAEYQRIHDAARAEYQRINDAAWADLATTCDNELVGWIIANCDAYRQEALLILEALPATLEDLEEIAAREEWCGTWDSMVEDAKYAGVLDA